MTFRDFIKTLQTELNRLGEKLTVDGDHGPKTLAALSKYEVTVTARAAEKNQTTGQPAAKKDPPWYSFAKTFDGKKETDASFAAFMVSKWKLVGLDLKTIATSWAAWCGLAMAVALSGVGLDYQKNGALAKNWATYGVEVDWTKDGIPKGSVVQINHSRCGDAAGNHVAVANGDCSAADLARAGATIDLYGGNQGNSWKKSTFAVRTICAVRWPKDVQDFPKPGPVLKSYSCSSSGPDGDSTR